MKSINHAEMKTLLFSPKLLVFSALFLIYGAHKLKSQELYGIAFTSKEYEYSQLNEALAIYFSSIYHDNLAIKAYRVIFWTSDNKLIPGMILDINPYSIPTKKFLDANFNTSGKPPGELFNVTQRFQGAIKLKQLHFDMREHPNHRGDANWTYRMVQRENGD